jgi:peroxin-1
MAPKKPAGNVVQAEVALKQSLKNCLVNLPSTLVSVLVNANAVCVRAAAMRCIAN